MKNTNKSILSFSQDESHSTLSLLSSPDQPTHPDLPSFVKGSLNVSLNLILQFLPNFISLYFLGQYSTVQVQSTFGVVLVFSICLGYGIFEGLAAGLETFLTSIQSSLSIVIYQRTLVVCTFLMLPVIGIVWLIQAVAFPFLLPETSTIAGYMLLASTVSIYFNGLYMVSRSYMNSRHSFSNQLKSTLASNLVHVAACLFFFRYCQFTIYGAILAKIISDIFNLNFFLKLIGISSEIKLEVFQSIKRSQLMPLARKLLSRGFIVSVEFIAYETFTIQAVSLAFNEISTHIIAVNIHNIGYFIYIGASMVTYLNVSKYLLNNRKLSISYIKYGAVFMVVAAIASLLFLTLAPWRGVFTNEAGVIEHLIALTPFLITFMILDCLQAFISSLSRSLGEHSSAFKHYMISFFLIGQPVCFFLRSYAPANGVSNIWVSMIISVLVYNIWQGSVLLGIDLKEAARRIEEEMDDEESSRESFIEIHYPEFVREHSTKSYQGGEKAVEMVERKGSRTYSI